ncbi:uncharacterized protein DS421_19g647140 [Arachis hypogaea]|uniref:Uncharacterized protein n=1 Tax=Arachis hypogaea TaxID=3818 RepID=A0A6B9V745_ARAHY|nr:uncharacterized protein DS421_19g647140 [Arachis hypogaea]
MAKISVTLPITMLIIEMLICSTNAAESYNIVFMNDYISSTMTQFRMQCQKHYPYHLVKRTKCIQECCNTECYKLHQYDLKRYVECIKVLYALYIR